MKRKFLLLLSQFGQQALPPDPSRIALVYAPSSRLSWYHIHLRGQAVIFYVNSLESRRNILTNDIYESILLTTFKKRLSSGRWFNRQPAQDMISPVNTDAVIDRARRVTERISWQPLLVIHDILTSCPLPKSTKWHRQTGSKWRCSPSWVTTCKQRWRCFVMQLLCVLLRRFALQALLNAPLIPFRVGWLGLVVGLLWIIQDQIRSDSHPKGTERVLNTQRGYQAPTHPWPYTSFQIRI